MPEVTIYTAALCGYCNRAKRLLEEKGVEFTEHDVTFDRALRKKMSERAGGATSVPQVFVGETYIGGCIDLIDLDKNGGLDALLAEEAQKSA
jgi:glutaredoxin 3